MPQVKVDVWGGDLGICIPRGMADSLGFHAGDTVEVCPTGEGMLIRKTSPAVPSPTKRYRLADILDSFSTSSDYPEVDFGEPAGEEAW